MDVDIRSARAKQIDRTQSSPGQARECTNTLPEEMRLSMNKAPLLIAILSLGTLCWAGSAREDATERLDNATNVMHEIMGVPTTEFRKKYWSMQSA